MQYNEIQHNYLDRSADVTLPVLFAINHKNTHSSQTHQLRVLQRSLTRVELEVTGAGVHTLLAGLMQRCARFVLHTHPLITVCTVVQNY